MNQLYLHVVIFKKQWLRAVIPMTIAFYSIFFNALPSFAKDDYEVTAHFYRVNPEKPGKYYDAIQWKVTSSGEWNAFVNRLKDLPPGKEIDSPMQTGAPDVVHFAQVNPDKISGNDIYLSRDGIYQYAKMPFDTYHYQNYDIRKFLDAELRKHDSYGGDTSGVKITDPGIVVVYRGSTVLQNPTWQVIEPKEFEKYKAFVDKLTPLPQGQTLRTELGKTIYDDVGTFVLYLNYPGAPFQLLSVTIEGGARGTKIDLIRYAYEDPKGYYKSFKGQAETSIKENQDRKNKIKFGDKARQF